MGTVSSIDKNKIATKTTEGKDMTFEVTLMMSFKRGTAKGSQKDAKAGMRVVVNVGDGVEPLKAKEVQDLGAGDHREATIPSRDNRPASPKRSVEPASPKRSVGGALAIAIKDATEIWRDGRFRWAAGLLLLLLIAAVAGGVHNQSQIARQHAAAQRAEREIGAAL